jgi:thermitase
MKRWSVLALASTLLVAAVFAAPTRAAKSGDEDARVLVKFKKDVNQAEREQAVKDKKAEKVDEVYGDDVWVVESKEGKKDKDLANDFKNDSKVVYAEPDVDLHIFVAPPNDPQFGSQYAMQRVNAVAGWSVYPNGYQASGGPTIAVIDTGIDRNHPDLASKLDTANSRCFGTLCFLTGYEDDNGHGSHTAGTAAAATNNGVGVAGVAVNSRIMALKVCDLIGTCNTSSVASAINWAASHGAKVISMSLGGGGTTTMQTAVASAYNAGVTLVAAAGNDGNATLNYPAAYAQVVSVAATDANDARASFSNANADVELAAPGVNVLSTYSGDGYTTISGTSMSTPHVAGLAALLKGQNPSWTPAQIRARMNSCSDDLGTPGWDSSFGNGRINLGRALGTC